jgi:hypothetical protein
MAEFESPTCALDLRHRSNCLGIVSAKSGQEIRVLVRPEGERIRLLQPEAQGFLA